MINITYTPGTPPTRPLKNAGFTYLNTPEIAAYTHSLNGFELNQQHKNAHNLFSVRGFEIIIKGMAIIVSRGVCILKRGASVINYTHDSTKFFIERELPLAKTEIFYLAINRTNEHNGDAVLFLFNRESDITNDWIVLKKIIIPIHAVSLDNLEIHENYPPEPVSIYNYVMPQPDGKRLSYEISQNIKPGSICLYLNNMRYTAFTVTHGINNAIISTSTALAANAKLIADFVTYV